jgi:hypothetical protein
VAGIDGHAASSSRIRGSNPSATDPAGGRSYLGGLSLASAAFTVFREIPITRAIRAIGICSARLSRRISAQSSTFSTCFLPDSARARVSGKLVNFRLPRCGQYSVAVDTGEITNGAAEQNGGSGSPRLLRSLIPGASIWFVRVRTFDRPGRSIVTVLLETSM